MKQRSDAVPVEPGDVFGGCRACANSNRAGAAEAVALLRELTDVEPCRYYGDLMCMTHPWGRFIGGRCPTGLARDFIAHHHPPQGDRMTTTSRPEWPAAEPDADTLIDYACGRGLWVYAAGWGILDATRRPNQDPASYMLTATRAEAQHWHDVHVLLTSLQQVDQGRADAAAARIWQAAMAGDAYGEWLWEWASDRGINAQDLSDDGQVTGRGWLDDTQNLAADLAAREAAATVADLRQEVAALAHRLDHLHPSRWEDETAEIGRALHRLATGTQTEVPS